MRKGVSMYPFVAIPEEDGSGWSIQFPDLPGATGFTANIESIGEEAKLVADLWLANLEEDDIEVPVPSLDWDPINRQPEDFKIDHVFTAKEVADILNISPRRVNALASSRGFGRFIGKAKVFTSIEVERLKTRKPGRPKMMAPSGG